MRNLVFSIILLTLVGCASLPKKMGFQEVENTSKTLKNPYFANPKLDYVYKASIEVYKNQFSGILIVKKLGENHHRLVFTTEMGNTIFDFSFINNSFKVNRIIDQLDKKLLVNILKRDFSALINETILSQAVYQNGNSLLYETKILGKKHFYLTENEELKKITKTGNGKVKVVYLYSENNSNIATHISILHKNIKLSILLKALKN